MPELIESEKARFPVAMMCRALGVSRSGFYASRSRPISRRGEENVQLTREIQQVYDDSRGTYGSPRICVELRTDSRRIGRHRIARLMRTAGLSARPRRRWRSTTDSTHSSAIAENVLNREFQVTEPNRVWASDITYVRTHEGWLYLAVVLDLFSRRVVGWSMAGHLRTELVSNALRMALGTRRVSPQLLHHSDRGSQYASDAYRDLLGSHGLECSMSRKGNCWDNAVVESFFGTLKTELIHPRTWRTRREVRSAIYEYLEVFYNRRRRHSHLGYCSPADFEKIGTSPS